MKTGRMKKHIMRKLCPVLSVLLATACANMRANEQEAPSIVPAESFARAVHNGTAQDYSFHRARSAAPVAAAQAPRPYGDMPAAYADAAQARRQPVSAYEARQQAMAGSTPAMALGRNPQDQRTRASMSAYGNQPTSAPLPIREVRSPNKLMRAQFTGDRRYLDQGFSLKGSAVAPTPVDFQNGGAVPGTTSGVSGQFPHPPVAAMPPGSRAPYHTGQMRHNPSLWPDEAQGAFLFTDHRAFQAMDVLTITINESTKGSKKAETETTNEFDLLAGITEFFGIETSKWAANNTSLDPSQLINASTQVEFTGTGETEREGRLSGQISAVIMEVFPNGLLRVEGTKIVSINAEEEVMVISGLIRPRDISSNNQVDSNRIANMRIDLYGRGVVGDEQTPGWGARLFKFVWPF